MKRKDKKYLENLRHSTSHLLAAAVVNLYPQAKPTIGPPTDEGFYYDFDFQGQKISEADFPRIEEEMRKIVKGWNGFKKINVDKEKAINQFKDNQYKKELIEEFTSVGKKITLYKSGNFIDLCKGGHIKNPAKEIKYFKLLSIAGAYWRGNEKNPMLTRIYGTVFPEKRDLSSFLKMQEELKKRDHRKIGEELNLFIFSEEVGPGLPLWTPKGTILQLEIRNWAEETEKKWGYQRVRTPHIAKHTLFEISGHLPYYKDDMFPPMNVEGEEYYLKGMNCPHHHMIYKSKSRSYRELPLRLAEYGEVYRYEQSGTLFGLMRVRFIQQNDAHIYCTEEQAEEEFLNVLKLHEYYYNTLGLTKKDYYVVVGLPDEGKKEKYHGDKKLWDKAERMMREAIKKSGIRSFDDVGGAAFYGPKVDFNIKSSIGRVFSISTSQLDLFMPTRFNLEYTDPKGIKRKTVVIHRAPLGSHERFIGFLIEHFAGEFPVWLSPVQVKVITVSKRNTAYAQKVFEILSGKNIRTELDLRNATVPAKVREATILKIPYMFVLGDKEEKENSVSIRRRDGKNLAGVPLVESIKLVERKIKEKSLSL